MSYATPDAIRQRSREVRIPARTVVLEGELQCQPEASSIILFAHDSGSGRHSPRNQQVARTLWAKGLGTLLFDLLTREEEVLDQVTGHLRFDIEFLCERLMDATRWVLSATDLRGPAIGYFGASTGAGAALMAAAELGDSSALSFRAAAARIWPQPRCRASSRQRYSLSVAWTTPVIKLNEKALALLGSEKRLQIVSGASHLFEEPGALAEVARLAGEWFERYLSTPSAHTGPPS